MILLITGGTGFIGRALVDKLLNDGHRLTILTRDERKVDSSFNKKVEVLEADIGHLASLEKLDLRLKGIDVIFHLAASLDYFGDRKKLFRANVEGTINLLNWAERNGIKKFIYISSIEAMGTIEKDNIPAGESYTCNPVSSYGESKLEAEKQIGRFAERRKLSTVILRLGNVYGPGSQTFILPIADAVLKKDNLLRFLPVFKDRYFHPVYIEDVVDGIVRAGEKSDAHGTYILAGEEHITVGALFVLIAEMLNVDLQIKERSIKDNVYLNFRKKIHQLFKKADLLTYFMAGEGKRIHRAYFIEKAKSKLDYLPKVNLKEGISKTLQWAEREGLRGR